MAWKPNDYGTLGLTYDHGASFLDYGKVRLGYRLRYPLGLLCLREDFAEGMEGISS